MYLFHLFFTFIFVILPFVPCFSTNLSMDKAKSLFNFKWSPKLYVRKGMGPEKKNVVCDVIYMQISCRIADRYIIIILKNPIKYYHRLMLRTVITTDLNHPSSTYILDQTVPVYKNSTRLYNTGSTVPKCDGLVSVIHILTNRLKMMTH